METRNFDLKSFEVRATDNGVQHAAGYAAVFNADSEDLGGFVEVIEPGAFARSLGQVQAGSLNIYALWAHDSSQPLGSTKSGKLKLSEDDRGLAFELDTKRFSPAQLDALEDEELRMSFGFKVRDQEWKELDDGTILRILRDVDITEVSFVINPAYPDTSAAKRSLDKWKEERTGDDVVEVLATFSKTAQELTRELGERVLVLRKRALQASLKARGRL